MQIDFIQFLTQAAGLVGVEARVVNVAAETDAAKAAGLRALLIDRDTGQGDIASFAEVLP